ncbi:MAG: hypothetical protein IKD64_01745 [Lachnospiraceae bacterium]|nr:hypothetical protein [Lachnospiraceae bacterium]
MEFEENKDNFIEKNDLTEEQSESVKTEEEVVSADLETAAEAAADDAAEKTAAEEAAAEEGTAAEAVSETDAADEAGETESAVEETESAAEETSTDETAEVVPEETAEESAEETAEPESEETAEEETTEPEPEEAVGQETVESELETAGAEETGDSESEETAVDEMAESESVEAENTNEPVEETATEIESEEPEIEFERVLPEVVVLEVTEEELADAVEPVKAEPEPEEELQPEELLQLEESIIEEEFQPEEEPQPQPEAFQEETSKEEAAQEETPTAKEPQTKDAAKKGKGSLAVKIVGIILLLIVIFVPAGYSLIKGEAFQKDLINQKKFLSRSYESIYRKEIFPKLSQLFIPEWAKQPEVKPEPEPPTVPQGSASVDPDAHIPDADKPKGLLDGVPQVPEGQEYYPLYIEDHMIVYGRDNWLFTAGDGSSSLEYFAGTNVLAEEDLAYCAEVLNTLYEICNAKGVELVMEVGPNKEQVYPEFFPSVTVENNQKRLLLLEQYLHENCSAPFVYPIRELAAHKDQYDTYWKYDTHWNTTGSYIGMKAIYEALGRPISDKYAVMRTEETNRGDLAGITGYTDPYTDYITEYKPNISVETEVYCDWEYDIDDYGKRYISSAQNERKLFVCGDSFRVSLAAHMCKDYKYTDVVHRDIVGLEIPVERLQALTEGDTLVLVCVERWDYYMFGVIPIIIEAMQ